LLKAAPIWGGGKLFSLLVCLSVCLVDTTPHLLRFLMGGVGSKLRVGYSRLYGGHPHALASNLVIDVAQEDCQQLGVTPIFIVSVGTSLRRP
jgi:hypothetical protein